MTSSFHTSFLFFSDVVSPYPQYSFDKDNCVYKTYTQDEETGEHIFTIQHGDRFLLKLDFSDYPRDSPQYRVFLYREGETPLHGVSRNAFYWDVDTVDIQIVTKQHESSYVLRCKSSIVGEATF